MLKLKYKLMISLLICGFILNFYDTYTNKVFSLFHSVYSEMCNNVINGINDRVSLYVPPVEQNLLQKLIFIFISYVNLFPLPFFAIFSLIILAVISGLATIIDLYLLFAYFIIDHYVQISFITSYASIITFVLFIIELLLGIL